MGLPLLILENDACCVGGRGAGGGLTGTFEGCAVGCASRGGRLDGPAAHP